MHNNNKPKMTGTFSISEDGVLDFNTVTPPGVTFLDAMECILKVRDEIDRLIANSSKCPYHEVGPNNPTEKNQLIKLEPEWKE